MKVLFVCQKIHRENENPFVRVLVEGLQKNGIEVDWGLDNFWDHYRKYDLIHFQWPEKVFGGGKKIDMQRIEQHIELLKKLGIKLVITCHNLRPHKDNSELSELYDFLYSNCDAIHHMGEFSYNYLKEHTDKNVYHFIIDHHTYHKLGDYNITRKEARNYLSIPENANVVLSFGAFRFGAERKMVIEAFNNLDVSNKILLAPGFFKDKTMVGYYYHKLVVGLSSKYKDLRFSKGFVPYSQLPYYLIASDILLIQRQEILNSGNLALGFSFGKVVVGPKKGNVGFILDKTENFTFDPADAKSVSDALKQSFLHVADKGINNLDYACKHMDQQSVTERLITQYHYILDGKNDKKEHI